MPSQQVPVPARAAPSCLLRLLAAWLVIGACGVAQPATRTPTGGGGSVELQPVPPRDSPRAWRRLVFTCATPGLVIFSDRPCGPMPTLHEVKVPAPGASPTVAAPAPAASTRPAPALPAREDPRRAEDEDRHTEACRRLESGVQALDARMRAGYSAREAARLWARWREAKERLREADC
ncbi:MAG TPA: hypothetical protein VFI92_13565 [Steroidobacteraceae bacterium]|nr:hypothetical protein [Steroidobacteraceae bacterium]